MRSWYSIVLEHKPQPVIRKIAPCGSCGYDLHGLPPDGRCPECGSVVGASLRRELIRFSQPGWVADLRRGLSLLLVGSLLGVASGLLLTLTDMVSRLGQDGLTILLAVWFVLCSSATLGSFIAGVLLLSRREPRELPEMRGGWVRIAFRWGWIPAWSWFLYCMSTDGGLSSLDSGSCALGVLVTSGWLVLLILYLSRLAELLTSRALRRASRACLVILIGAIACVFWLPVCAIAADMPDVGRTVAFRLRPTPTHPSGRAVTLLQLWWLTLCIAVPIAGASMLLLFGQARWIFRSASEQARENWSRPIARA